MRRTGAALAAVAVTSATLTGCSFSVGSGGAPVVAKADLQKDISDRLDKAGQKPKSVTCKDDLKGEVGKSVTCEVALTDTNVFEPVVTVTKVDGSTVSYDMTPAVSKEQLEKAVGRLLSESAGTPVDSITCESRLEGKKGSEAQCEVSQGGITLKRTVDVTNVDGLLMNFTVIPVLVKAQVESSLLDQLETQLGQRPDSADCTSDLEGKPGTTIDCTVVAGEETQAFTLTVTNADGDRINFDYAPKA
ncbi:DUF4333 domain-containing protein [Candidatus Mycolicibacterium alkanivorans]|uniref:DUF4333 domain-containing protein n=1 Tax=Candidatus Mycolicibacterium alkanivorans TaxID=2954114 RepID=A0ABS9YWA8_9MYCO|nr:DUF4333 domain-containing protein [Candidatus Mycolicibacterium alkanivorans]MCI4675516.1 DUF4333 domain-containing protein [Candidatus Mycolicibacterium alkanivorans]